ncbi:hypothetical protein AAG570_004236 [Ranatra chinensis]|uniref:Uncharacterized protein n=1 Tax=Ranatra chinensis TaxID=642074 RepID=A0ABD0Y3K0_9HEMI
MASKRRNMFQENKTQETTENETLSEFHSWPSYFLEIMRSRQPPGKRKKKKAKWGGGLKKSDKVKLNIGHKLFMVSEESLLRRKLVGNERLALHTGTPTNPMLDLAMSRKRTRIYPEWEQSDMSLTPGEKGNAGGSSM